MNLALQRDAAIGQRFGRLLHRIHRWDTRHAAHAERCHPGLQHLGTGDGTRHCFDPVLYDASSKRDPLGLPSRED